MLNRSYFVLFCGGFSLSLVLKQLALVLSIPSQRRFGYLLLVWSGYIIIQLANTWSTLQGNTLSGITLAVSTSTLFYSACVTWLLYISMQRYLAINHEAKYKLVIRRGTIALMLTIFVIRFVRTILIYIQNSGSAVFPAAATMQQNSTKLIAFYQLRYYLVVELILTLFSIVVAVLESLNYSGNNVADMDWIMISWAISALLEQSQILSKLFAEGSSVSGNKVTSTPKKAIEKTGNTSASDL
ncbi:hypothetical protein HDV04_000630 [Boothiomyces sp. JEL0838]|nr:hypothetical protein HDV04_000630 [Boothiomyces sp. JEL0838]